MLNLSQIGIYVLLQIPLCLLAAVAARLLQRKLVRSRSAERKDSSLVFLFCALIYIAGSPGVITTSDEDLLALVRAVSRGGTLEITEYTRSVHDAARRDDRFYSHKPPGVALAALPFYNLPRLLEPILVHLDSSRSGRIIQTDEGRFAVDRCPGPSTYMLKLEDAPRLNRLELRVHNTFARPTNFLLSETTVCGPDGQPVRLKVDSVSEVAAARSPSETCDGEFGEDQVHGWPGSRRSLSLPVSVTWRFDRPIVPTRLELAQLSPFRDHLIRSFDLFGEDPEGGQHILRAREAHVRPSTVEWCEEAACAAIGIVSAMGVFLLFRLLRSFGIGRILATLVSFLFAFGTLQWRYGAAFYNHTLLAVCTLGALYGLKRVLEDPEEGSGWWVLSWSLAWGILADVIFVVVLVICPLVTIPSFRRAQKRDLLIACLPPAVSIFLLGVYQWICFGAPWAFPQAFSYHHPWLGSFSTAFDFPLLKGLRILLFHHGSLDGIVRSAPWINADLSRTFYGLFAMSPYLLFALLGLMSFLREQPRFAVGALAVFVVTVLIMARFRTPWGGDDYDVRYIHHVIPVLFIPLALWLRGLAGSTRARQLLFGVPFVAAVLLGIIRNIGHLADGPGRAEMVIRLGANWLTIPRFPDWHVASVVGPPLIVFVLFLQSRRPERAG